MTRMWCVDPRILCTQHLVGEHAELHQLVGSIKAGHTSTVRGHASEGQIDTRRITARHSALVEEMERRDMSHQSPLEYNDDLGLGTVDSIANVKDLANRCGECYERIKAGP